MVYQDPTQALSPAMRIGDQLAEVFHYHEGMDKKAALEQARESLRARRHPRSRRDPAPLPLRAVGRPAAARRHRDGAGREPAAAHPRRAHHRPRRHRRGGDPGPDRGAARPHQRRHPPDHPQPGAGRPPLRARRRALRGAAGRGGLGQGSLHRSASPLHDGAAALRPALRHEQDRRRAPDHPRDAPCPRRPARGLRLLGALPDGPAGLQAPRARLLRVAGRRRASRARPRPRPCRPTPPPTRRITRCRSANPPATRAATSRRTSSPCRT